MQRLEVRMVSVLKKLPASEIPERREHVMGRETLDVIDDVLSRNLWQLGAAIGK